MKKQKCSTNNVVR